MQPRVNDLYQALGEKYNLQGPFLEVGAAAKLNSILAGRYFKGRPKRFAINMVDMEMPDEPEGERVTFLRCNANNMKRVFADGQFATVLCNAMIEHDKYFWRSLDEMKRVLAPGGILAVGAPGFVGRKNIKADIISEKYTSATLTMDVHAVPDYWRFSRYAFKDVICEGLEFLETVVLGQVPVLVAVARKPLAKRAVRLEERRLRQLRRQRRQERLNKTAPAGADADADEG